MTGQGKKRLSVMIFLLLIWTGFLGILPAAADASVVLTVGETGQYSSIQKALDALAGKSGTAVVRFLGTRIKESDADLHLPEDASITKLSFEGEEKTVRITGPKRMFLSGISFSLGTGVSFPEMVLYGGSDADGIETSDPGADIEISGEIQTVIGGGYAHNGGRAKTEGPIRIRVTESGNIVTEIYGGGQAEGKGCLAQAQTTDIRCDGTADYIFGGGRADGSGRTIMQGETNITVGEKGVVRTAVFGGNCVAEAGSFSEGTSANISIYGDANTSFGGDYVFSGGKALMTGYAVTIIQNSGYVKKVFGASMAADDGSSASVFMASVSVYGKVDTVIADGQVTGKAESIVHAQPQVIYWNR